MKSRRAVVALVLACGYILGLPMVASGATSVNPAAGACAKSHTLTLIADSAVRVYGDASDRAFACFISSGKSHRLGGASASQDVFALGGGWVAWTSSQHTTVTVMNVGTGKVPNTYPYGVNDFVVNVVVKKDGAAAWAADVDDGTSYVEGFDRKNHSADSLSDDTKYVRGATLKSHSDHAVSWKYSDGSTGKADLF